MKDLASSLGKNKKFLIFGCGFSGSFFAKTIKKLRQISKIEIEISGGVTIENVAEYAKNTDFISLGSLTMSSLPVDFSLHVV